MQKQMYTKKDVKLIPIGKSRGIRLPESILQKYGFSGTLLLEETDQGVLLRKKEAPSKDKKLSWEETYKEMVAESENWDDFDITLLDGIDGEEFDTQKI